MDGDDVPGDYTRRTPPDGIAYGEIGKRKSRSLLYCGFSLFAYYLDDAKENTGFSDERLESIIYPWRTRKHSTPMPMN